MEKRVLIVYSTCAPDAAKNVSHWHQTFHKLLEQDLSCFWNSEGKQVDLSVDYVISDCMSSDNHLTDIKYMISKAKAKFPERRCCVNSLRTPVGLPVSFNYACKRMTKLYGEYDAYMMLPSDVFFKYHNSMKNMIATLLLNKHIGILNPGQLEDLPLCDGSSSEFSRYDPNGGIIDLPVGAICNAVFLLFSGYYAKKYKFKPWGDILQSFRSEGLLTFQTSAIKRTWSVDKTALLEVGGYGKDGPCVFHRDANGAVIHSAPFNANYDINKLVKDGYNVGLGWAELDSFDGVQIHDPKHFDGLYAKSDKLYNYILKNLYIKSTDFNYNSYKISEFYEV